MNTETEKDMSDINSICETCGFNRGFHEYPGLNCPVNPYNIGNEPGGYLETVFKFTEPAVAAYRESLKEKVNAELKISKHMMERTHSDFIDTQCLNKVECYEWFLSLLESPQQTMKQE